MRDEQETQIVEELFSEPVITEDGIGDCVLDKRDKKEETETKEKEPSP